MPHSLSAQLRQQIGAVVAEQIAPLAPVIDQEGRWPEEGMRALQSAGLGGLVVPQETGGHGYGLLGLIEACELIGRACASTALCFGMHCVGSAVIAARATDHQKNSLLVPIARGEHITTLALSERGSGSHFYFPQTELEHQEDGGFRVRGAKSFVTNGGYADSYVLSTMAPADDQPLGQFSCVVLYEGSSGMEWGEPWRGMGMRGNASRTLTLTDVSLPSEALLGREGDQIWYVFFVITPFFLAAMSGTYLGLASAAVDEVRHHLGERSYAHSGQRLSEMTVLQHRLGTLWAKVEQTRRLAYYAGAEGDTQSTESLPALFSAKAEVADCAVAVVNEALTLKGGMAYGEASSLSRMLRDARAAHVMAPTTDMLRTWTGRVLLGQPILGD